MDINGNLMKSTPLNNAHDNIQRAEVQEQNGHFEEALKIHKVVLNDLKRTLDCSSCASVVRSLHLQIEFQQRQIELLSNKVRNIQDLAETAFANIFLEMSDTKPGSIEGSVDNSTSEVSGSRSIGSFTISDNCQALMTLTCSLENQIRKPDLKITNLLATVDRIHFHNREIASFAKNLSSENTTLQFEIENLKFKIKALELRAKPIALNSSEESTRLNLLSVDDDDGDISTSYDLPPLPNPKFDLIENPSIPSTDFHSLEALAEKMSFEPMFPSLEKKEDSS